VDGLIEAAEAAPVAAARGAGAARAGAITEFAGRGRFVGGQERLAQQERAVMEARQMHKLTPAMRLPTGELGLGELRTIAGAERPELADVAREIKEVQEAIVAYRCFSGSRNGQGCSRFQRYRCPEND
jgi:hypothetical protein